MSTKTIGYQQSHLRQYATGERDPIAKHKIEEGCAREPMYSRHCSYDGVREQLPSDHVYEGLYSER